MKKLVLALLCLPFTSFGQNVQGEMNLVVEQPSTMKEEIFSVEVLGSDLKDKKISVYEFYGKTSDGRKLLAVTFDGSLFSQSQTLPEDSVLLLSGPILDDARILQLRKELGDMLRINRDIYLDSLDFFSHKHKDVTKSQRKNGKKRIQKNLQKIEASDRRNLDYYFTILSVRKGRAIVVYGHQFKERKDQTGSIKKSSPRVKRVVQKKPKT